MTAGQYSVYLSANLKKSPAWNKNNGSVQSKEPYFKVFPNPSGTFFIIEYDLRKFINPGIIRISDMVGRDLIEFPLKDKQNQRIVDTKAFSTGTYLVKLFIANNLIEIQKISIIK